MGTIRFDETTLWILQSFGEHNQIMFYYQTPFEWTTKPSEATMFRSFDIAEMHMISCAQTHEDNATYDVVPFKGTLMRVVPTEDN